MKTLVALLALGSASPALAAPAKAPAPKGEAPAKMSKAKEEKIRQLLRMTRADQAGQEMLSELKKQLPAASYEQVAKVIRPEELAEQFVGVYDRHFSESEIDGLIAFYQTPLGERLVQESPQIARESVEIGQKYAIAKLTQARDAAQFQQLQQQGQKPAPSDVPKKAAP